MQSDLQCLVFVCEDLHENNCIVYCKFRDFRVTFISSKILSWPIKMLYRREYSIRRAINHSKSLVLMNISYSTAILSHLPIQKGQLSVN